MIIMMMDRKMFNDPKDARKEINHIELCNTMRRVQRTLQYMAS